VSQSPAPQAVFIDTYGCQMNELDSELVRSTLVSHGYRLVPAADAAEIVLINTCSVRALSEQKVWSQLGRLGIHKREKRPGLVIGVLGCMAERQSSAIAARMPHVDVICGPSSLDRLPALLEGVRRKEGRQVAVAGYASRRPSTLERVRDGMEALDLSRAFSPEKGRFQAFVRITRGCNKLCSFCVVPYTRGPEVHRPPEHIVDEVRRLAQAGVLEVTLIGQTVNHYRFTGGGATVSFAELLWRVHEEVPELPRLRFVTSYPRDFGDDVLDVMAASPRLCRYLHLPAQSGSDRLLRLMNRGYTVAEYLGLIDRARAKLPDVRFAGDMIVGFPGETDEEHEASLALVERVAYKNLFVFKYSPREGTVAERRLRDEVPEELKRRRNLEMLERQARLSLEANSRRVGDTLEVLVESQGKLKGDSLGRQERRSPARLVGRTAYDEIVAFDGAPELVGRLVRVRATAATSLTILGELASLRDNGVG
jgi:tRNA-2-methylthio-N6-dimethylallyladenosine synthase